MRNYANWCVCSVQAMSTFPFHTRDPLEMKVSGLKNPGSGKVIGDGPRGPFTSCVVGNMSVPLVYARGLDDSLHCLDTRQHPIVGWIQDIQYAKDMDVYCSDTCRKDTVEYKCFVHVYWSKA